MPKRKTTPKTFRELLKLQPNAEDAARLERLYGLTGITGSALVRRALFALELQEQRVRELMANNSGEARP